MSFTYKISFFQLVTSLFAGLAFCVPLFFIGIRLGNYNFSIATFFLLLISIVFFFKGTKANVFYPFLIFLFWCILTVVFRISIKQYIISLVALTIVVFPTTVCSYKYANKRVILKWFLFGLKASFVIAVYDLGQYFFNYPSFQNLFGDILLFSYMRDAEMLGIPRHVKSGFQEPAHYVVYLFLSFVILDNIENPKLYLINPKKLNHYKIVIVFFMIVTFSMSGYVVFAVYWITKRVLNLKDFLINLALMKERFVFQTSIKSILVGVFFLILVSLSFNYALKYYQSLVRDRLFKITDVIGNYNMSGSEASRVNSFFIIFKYWNDEGLSGMLVGEGYANYRDWLIENFGQLDRSRVSFARGHINNIIGVVGISTGIVGLIFFLIFNYSFIYNHKLKNGFLFLISLFLVYFIYDFLIGYLMWALINIYILINANSQKILYFKPKE